MRGRVLVDWQNIFPQVRSRVEKIKAASFVLQHGKNEISTCSFLLFLCFNIESPPLTLVLMIISTRRHWDWFGTNFPSNVVLYHFFVNLEENSLLNRGERQIRRASANRRSALTNQRVSMW